MAYSNAPTTPRVPTAAQLTQLATLQATENTAKTNYDGNVAATITAQASYLSAQQAVADYRNYIFGGGTRAAGVYDEGNPAAT